MKGINRDIENNKVKGSPKNKKYRDNYSLWEYVNENIPSFKTIRNTLVKDKSVFVENLTQLSSAEWKDTRV